MNFLTMEYFLAVASKRNITKAAEELNITQQTLSAHIATLEKELGAELLIRSNPIELTYAGEVFLKHAESIYEDWQSMWNEFNDITNNQRGKLVIGVDFTRSRTLLPGIISYFQEQYPNIEVRIMEGINRDIQNALIRKDIDIAIARFNEVIPGIEVRPYYNEEIVMIVPKELSKYGEIKSGKILSDISEFRNYPFILSNINDTAGLTGNKLINESGIKPTIKAKSNNIETLLEMSLNGIGVCFCTYSAVKTLVPETKMNDINIYHFMDTPIYRIQFGYRKTKYQWKMVSEFMRIAILERDKSLLI